MVHSDFSRFIAQSGEAGVSRDSRRKVVRLSLDNWTGASNGTDTVGLYNPTTSMFYLRSSNTTGFADTTFA
jgi:hypothetical protein